MDPIDSAMTAIRGRGLTVVLPESGDERILRAARRLVQEDLAQPVLVGARAEIEAVAGTAGIDLTGVAIRSTTDDQALPDLAENRGRRPFSELPRREEGPPPLLRPP